MCKDSGTPKSTCSCLVTSPCADPEERTGDSHIKHHNQYRNTARSMLTLTKQETSRTAMTDGRSVEEMSDERCEKMLLWFLIKISKKVCMSTWMRQIKKN